MTLHYSSGPVQGLKDAGFDLVDVSSLSQLNALPEGMKGLVWIGDNPGATTSFINQVTPFIGNPKLFGFRLGDEPDPEGRFGKARITFAQFKAETDWIRLNGRGAKSFTVLMDLGSYEAPSMTRDSVPAYTPSNTGLDLIGLDPYPIRSLAQDITYIDRMVNAAKAVGWTVNQIIPVFQAFGGGNYRTTTSGLDDRYVLPTVAQARAMFDRWKGLIPDPVFDFAWTYEEGVNKEDITSIGSTTPEALLLRKAFYDHNVSVVPPVVSNPDSEKLKTLASKIQDGSLKPTTPGNYFAADGSVLFLK